MRRVVDSEEHDRQRRTKGRTTIALADVSLPSLEAALSRAPHLFALPTRGEVTSGLAARRA